MSATDYTTEQRLAIDEQGQNILVSASAGSGKTTVLVERVIQKILKSETESVANLLVVTFTKAAAKGMRDKIKQALREAAEKTNNASLKQRLRKEMNLVGVADISTIDSFCTHLIKRYYYLIDLDPQFRMFADSTEQILLQQSVWDDVRETLYATNDTQFEHLVENFSDDRGDDGLTKVVQELDSFANGTPAPHEWLSQLPKLYEVESDSLTDTPFYQQRVVPILVGIVQQLLADINDNIELAVGDELSEVKTLLETDRELTAEILDLVQHASWETIRAKLLALKFKSFPRATTDEKKEIYAPFKPDREVFKKQLNNLQSTYFPLHEEQTMEVMAQSKQLVATLADVTWQYRQAYQAEKQQRHVMDFADLEHYALAILTTNSTDGDSIVEQLKNHYHEIMIDEYQDTNQLQESILTTIASTQPGNLFMVGDVKQSIYKFRLADPSLFLRKYEQFRQPESQDGEAIVLADNFRSVENITDFVNLIFKQLMDRQVGEMNYDQAAQLKFGARYYPDKGTSTEILLYESKTTPESDEPDEESLMPSDKTIGEIQMIGQRINRMVDSGEEIYDTKAKKKRSINFGDITILAPTKSNNNQIIEQFTQLGIPVTVNDAQNYFRATEIRIMMALLRVVDNPYQDIPLAAVLRSPIVGLDENELAYLRIQNKTDDYFAAVKTFHAGFDENTASDFAQQIYAKVDRFLHQLNQFKLIANQNRLVKLIWSIYDTTGFLDYVGGMPGGRQRQANLHALYERAHVYEESSFKGVFQFVRFIEQMQQQNQDLGEAPAQTSSNTVSVMTIHGSKGLQFPVVFLMNAAHQFNKNNFKENYLLDAKDGIGITYMTDERVTINTLQKQVLKDTIDRRDQAEEMRLLYVALTRAEQRLLITGSYQNVDKAIASWERAFQSNQMSLPTQVRLKTINFMDWIGMSLVRHPHFDVDLLTKDNEWPGLNSDDTKNTEFRIDKFTATDLQPKDAELTNQPVPAASKDVAKQTNKADNPIVGMSHDEIKRVLHFNYEHTAATMTTAYQSVSEIKRLFEDPDNLQLGQLEFAPQARQKGRYVSENFGQPKFMQTTVKPSAAQIGTATHLVLQTLDLAHEPTIATVEQVIVRLTAANIITNEVAQQINRQQILQFFATDLGQSILMHPEWLKREVPFSMLLNGAQLFAEINDPDEKVLIHGIIDGYLELDDEISLFDYKTDQLRDDGDRQASIAQIVDRYRGQVNLYAQALEQMTHKPVRHKYLYLLAANELVEIKHED